MVSATGLEYSIYAAVMADHSVRYRFEVECGELTNERPRSNRRGLEVRRVGYYNFLKAMEQPGSSPEPWFAPSSSSPRCRHDSIQARVYTLDSDFSDRDWCVMWRVSVMHSSLPTTS